MLAALHLLAAQMILATFAEGVCPPPGTTRAGLLQLSESNFEAPSDDERNHLALLLLSCLDDPDPDIRDGVVFEGLSTWLRAKALRPETVLGLEASLRETLSGEKDAAGFRLPFAALLLSEVARADRIEPILTDSVRAELVELAASSLSRVDDYRGFDAKEGWRHGVAHGADLALQLGLNPRVGPSGLKRLLEGISRQIAPAGAVSYTFGEPERLARAVVYIYRRNLLDASFWSAWIGSIGDPTPLDNWGAAFRSPEGLARRHNATAFLHALSFGGRALGDELGQRLGALADEALDRIAG